MTIHPDPDDLIEVMVTYIDPDTKEFSDTCLGVFPTRPDIYALNHISEQVAEKEAKAVISQFVDRSLSLWR